MALPPGGVFFLAFQWPLAQGTYTHVRLKFRPRTKGIAGFSSSLHLQNVRSNVRSQADYIDANASVTRARRLRMVLSLSGRQMAHRVTFQFQLTVGNTTQEPDESTVNRRLHEVLMTASRFFRAAHSFSL